MAEPIEKKIGRLLLNNRLKLVCAESCTGGQLSHLITNQPGASEYFLGGVVSYSNELKQQALHVPAETLQQFGAVSRETVLAMARGIRESCSFTAPENLIGIAITGIAGPDGGSEEKPVGTTWIGISSPRDEVAWSFQWKGSRTQNKERSARTALKLLQQYLTNYQNVNTKKKILVLTADAGFGHRSAANAVAAAVEEKYGKLCEITILNPLDDRRAPFILRDSQSDYDKIIRQIPELYQLGYSASDKAVPSAILESALTVMLFELMHDVLEEYKPDAILTTFPLYQSALTANFMVSGRSIPLLTVITDLSTLHRVWFHSRVDACLVPNETVRELALANGISPEKIFITGIPVHPNTVREVRSKTEIRASLGWETDRLTFLAVGSSRVKGLTDTLKILNHFGAACDIQLVAVAGKDQELYRQLKEIEWHIPAHIYEYTDQMPTFMHASDAIITKAGGLITTESLACGLPMILVDVIPGQETGNAELVISNGAGDMATDPISALEVFSHLVLEDHRLLNLRSEIAARLGKPNSSYAIADLLWDAAVRGPFSRGDLNNTIRLTLIDLLTRNQIKLTDGKTEKTKKEKSNKKTNHQSGLI